MQPKQHRLTGARGLLSALCAIALIPGSAGFASSLGSMGRQVPAPANATTAIPAEQLDSLVAPIALYPDPLLAQTLAASTYPLEIMQLQQWLTRNQGLKDQALADAVAKQSWDPSVQAMAALPDLVKRLADDIQWTTDLGNAFLAQQSDVMDAVQRMRRKAQEKGTLESTPQQTVETKVVESKQVIVVEQADPQVVYLPSYDPMVVYGPPVYPYPPIYYPPPGAYAAGMAISWGVGVAMGAAWGGGWGWNAGWGHNDININNNNNFNRNTNVNRGGSGGSNWQHNPQHRGGAPYRDRSTADRFGGTARGDSLANRQAGARQQIDRQGGNVRSNAAAGTMGAGGRTPAGGAGNRAGAAGAGNRPGGTSPGTMGNRPSGGDRVGGRDVSSGRTGSAGAFGSASGRSSGARERASSSRGASSARSGGAQRSGGSRGGGRRR